MWRLTFAVSKAASPAVSPPADRAAAIASMAQRLAAAGPRTRRRLVDQRGVPVLTRAASATGSVVAELDEPPERRTTSLVVGRSWRETAAAVCRVVFLGAAATSGFGLMILAQTMVHRKPEPASVIKPEAFAAVAPSLVVAAPDPARSLPARAGLPAAVPAVIGSADIQPPRIVASPRLPSIVAPIAAHMRLVSAEADGARAPPPPLAVARPVRAVLARYELPRWLTENAVAQPHAQPRILIMSPPPHDLTPPPGAMAAHVLQMPAPAIVLPHSAAYAGGVYGAYIPVARAPAYPAYAGYAWPYSIPAYRTP